MKEVTLILNFHSECDSDLELRGSASTSSLMGQTVNRNVPTSFGGYPSHQTSAPTVSLPHINIGGGMGMDPSSSELDALAELGDLFGSSSSKWHRFSFCGCESAHDHHCLWCSRSCLCICLG